MKVLVLAPAPPIGAPRGALTAHSFIDEELLGLSRAGVQVLVLSENDSAAVRRGLVRTVPLQGPRVRDVIPVLAAFARHAADPGVITWRAARERIHACRIDHAVRRAIASESVSLVHTHFGWPNGLGGLEAAQALGVPLVASFRGMDLLVREEFQHGLRRNRAYDAAVRRLARAATVTVYASDFMRRAGIEAGAPPEGALVVRKGVNLRRFMPAPDRTLAQERLGVQGPMLLAVGQLKPLKAYAALLEALSPLRHLRWTLVICGEGPERGSLERRARQRDLNGRVVFAGHVSRERIPAFFAAADLFVHPARVEAAGNVVLEALASGCPVVCTDAGGPAEYVEDGETGIVVPSGDVQALSKAVRALLQHAPVRRAMSEAARRRSELEYSRERFVSDLIKMYTLAARLNERARARSSGVRRAWQAG